MVGPFLKKKSGRLQQKASFRAKCTDGGGPLFQINNPSIRFYLRKNRLYGPIYSQTLLQHLANNVKKMIRLISTDINQLLFGEKCCGLMKQILNFLTAGIVKFAEGRKANLCVTTQSNQSWRWSSHNVGLLHGDKAGNLHHVQRIMTKEQYHSILVRHAIPSGLHLGGRGLIFQQPTILNIHPSFARITSKRK